MLCFLVLRFCVVFCVFLSCVSVLCSVALYFCCAVLLSLSYPVLFCVVLSFLDFCCAVLRRLVLSYKVLPCVVFFIALRCLVLSVLSCFVVFYGVGVSPSCQFLTPSSSSRLVLSCIVLTSLTLPYLVLSSLLLLLPTFPCLASSLPC